MPEYRCKVYYTETFEAEIVVKAFSEEEVDLAVELVIKADKLLGKPTIEWELHDDSFEVVETSEV